MDDYFNNEDESKEKAKLNNFTVLRDPDSNRYTEMETLQKFKYYLNDTFSNLSDEFRSEVYENTVSKYFHMNSSYNHMSYLSNKAPTNNHIWESHNRNTFAHQKPPFNSHWNQPSLPESLINMIVQNNLNLSNEKCKKMSRTSSKKKLPSVPKMRIRKQDCRLKYNAVGVYWKSSENRVYARFTWQTRKYSKSFYVGEDKKYVTVAQAEKDAIRFLLINSPLHRKIHLPDFRFTPSDEEKDEPYVGSYALEKAILYESVQLHSPPPKDDPSYTHFFKNLSENV